MGTAGRQMAFLRQEQGEDKAWPVALKFGRDSDWGSDSPPGMEPEEDFVQARFGHSKLPRVEVRRAERGM
jgi:hypothetical protein